MNNLADRINSIESQRLELDAMMAALKPDFEAHITDKNIPLNERWRFWLDAPDDLKNHLENLPCSDAAPLICTFLVDAITDSGVEHGECHTRIDIGSEVKELVTTEADAALVTEEVLHQNLGSFCYDL